MCACVCVCYLVCVRVLVRECVCGCVCVYEYGNGTCRPMCDIRVRVYVCTDVGGYAYVWVYAAVCAGCVCGVQGCVVMFG